MHPHAQFDLHTKRILNTLRKIMPRRTTLQDIADALGLNQSTVSRALHDSPRIPKKTCEQVKAMAAKLGYQKHPAYGFLSDCRWKRPFTNDGMVIGVVLAEERPGIHMIDSIHKEAMALGFRLAIFAVKKGRGHILHRILQARNISGIILAWDAYTALEDDFPLEYYSIVLARPRNERLPFVTVRDNPFEQTYTLLNELKHRGYKKIGLCTWREADSEIDDRIIGAYSCFCFNYPSFATIPPFTLSQSELYRLRDEHGLPLHCPGFDQWLARNKPDAVLGFNALVFYWIRKAGYRMPEDIGFIEQRTIRSYALNQIGAIAVNQLDLLMRQNKRGRLDHRVLIVTEATKWVDFPTVRSVDTTIRHIEYPPPPDPELDIGIRIEHI